MFINSRITRQEKKCHIKASRKTREQLNWQETVKKGVVEIVWRMVNKKRDIYNPKLRSYVQAEGVSNAISWMPTAVKPHRRRESKLDKICPSSDSVVGTGKIHDTTLNVRPLMSSLRQWLEHVRSLFSVFSQFIIKYRSTLKCPRRHAREVASRLSQLVLLALQWRQQQRFVGRRSQKHHLPDWRICVFLQGRRWVFCLTQHSSHSGVCFWLSAV